MEPTIYRIENIDTGEVHEGTSKELAAIVGVTKGTVTKAALDCFKLHRCWNVVKISGPEKRQGSNIINGVCPNCGNKFVPIKKSQTYCSSLCCRQYNVKSFYEEMREYTKFKEGRAKKEKPKPKPKKSIDEISREAEAAGMKYGDYVAMTEYGMKIER